MTDETKKWYKSKTIIANIIALLAIIVQSQTGFIINPEEQVAIVILLNLVLRIITNKGLEL